MNFEEWQTKHTDQLFNGTCSEKSYLRLKSLGNIEVGVSPRLSRSDARTLVFHGRMRVAYAPDTPAPKQAVDFDTTPVDAGMVNERGVAAEEDGVVIQFPDVKPGAKSMRLQKLFDVIPDGQFSAVSTERVSFAFAIPLPFNVAQGATLQAVLQDNSFTRDLLALLVQPAGGWDEALLESAAEALREYFVLTADQFELFVEPVANQSPAEQLPTLVTNFLGALKAKAAQANITAPAEPDVAPTAAVSVH